MEKIIQRSIDKFSEDQLQVLLTSVIGDGGIHVQSSNNSYYYTSSINEDYINYKKNLLGDLALSVKKIGNNGYKKGFIYRLITKTLPEITYFNKLPLKDTLPLLNDKGLSMIFYDDGTLHKHNYFYNLCTHKYDKQDHEELLKPYFDSIGLECKVLPERKKDGRIFYYLYFPKYLSGYKISKLLMENFVSGYGYKIWDKNILDIWTEQINSNIKNKKDVNSFTFHNQIKVH